LPTIGGWRWSEIREVQRGYEGRRQKRGSDSGGGSYGKASAGQIDMVAIKGNSESCLGSPTEGKIMPQTRLRKASKVSRRGEGLEEFGGGVAQRGKGN